MRGKRFGHHSLSYWSWMMLNKMCCSRHCYWDFWWLCGFSVWPLPQSLLLSYGYSLSLSTHVACPWNQAPLTSLIICSNSTVKLGADSCKTAKNKQTILLHFLCTLSWSNTKHVYWKRDTYIFSLPMGNMSKGTTALSTRTGSGIQFYLSDWIHCGREESPGIYLHLHCRFFEQFAVQLVTSYEFMCHLLWSPRQSSFLKSCCNSSICSNLSSYCKGVSQCFGALLIIYYSIHWKVGAGWLEPIERLYIQLKLEHGV